ncbi:hypothetical protein HRI_003359000 [Hibiscus trionum]|uniref:Neprosin activation peptide domain-containing protein n=1 Tax=Hibiscus trionum TaxID=183268 RepID=A0A9W7IHQ4_HIBTR|nr:hypothetical protein HRI_003359000 [Hibiscus trionum]
MASSCWWCCKISPITHAFVFFLFVSYSFCHVHSSETGGIDPKNQTFRPGDELQKLRVIRERLNKMNKPAVKTIQSPDGDIIDCVLLHHQPAFDHPKLKGQKPLDPPERPSGVHTNEIGAQDFQLWSMSGESCPEGTLPFILADPGSNPTKSKIFLAFIFFLQFGDTCHHMIGGGKLIK